MTILYLETNFLLSIATGRDPDAETLLADDLPSLRIVIPGVCYMEAVSVIEAMRKDLNQFVGVLEQRIAQVKRDSVSSHAAPALFHLQRSVSEVVDQFGEVEQRLLLAMTALFARAESIELRPEAIRDGVGRRVIPNDLADNLVLHCVGHHALGNPQEEKVLLTGNTKDFGKTEVIDFLKGCGIDPTFSRMAPFLGWFRSRPAGS
jgi:hypothetical protein